MVLLRRLASETGVIIITSVHQPSSRVFDSFDQVLCTINLRLTAATSHKQHCLPRQTGWEEEKDPGLQIGLRKLRMCMPFLERCLPDHRGRRKKYTIGTW